MNDSLSLDAPAIAERLRTAGLHAWADVIIGQIREVLVDAPHGDWARWIGALSALPEIHGGRIDFTDGAVGITPNLPFDAATLAQLRSALMVLHPWRKGPYRIDRLTIDTEWRSDWKWQRVLPHLHDLDGRLVLDVGCGNGYHCWRMAGAGARYVVGIDPTALFVAQFAAVRRLVDACQPALAARVDVLPLGIEQVPSGLGRFDSVFSMGVLYHRRSPLDHLVELRGALRGGGQLVLETLVIDGDDRAVLVPRGRYAKMRNVWFIPSSAALETWLGRCGFADVRTVDVTPTTCEEQRSTAWMRFESLADFLDPADTQLTAEGYPAPKRAIVTAIASDAARSASR